MRVGVPFYFLRNKFLNKRIGLFGLQIDNLARSNLPLFQKFKF